MSWTPNEKGEDMDAGRSDMANPHPACCRKCLLFMDFLEGYMIGVPVAGGKAVIVVRVRNMAGGYGERILAGSLLKW